MKRVMRLAVAFSASMAVACGGSEPDTSDAGPNDAASTPQDASLRDATRGDSESGMVDVGSGDDAPSADAGSPDAAIADANSAFDGPGDDGPVVDSAVPDGSCLLKYNSDVHFDGGANGTTGNECCYAAGSANACDLTGRCGAASGGGCCIVYSTPADQFPPACCFYEKGLKAPGDPRCIVIIDAGR